MDQLLTITDVMKRMRLGRTTVTKIVKSLPYVTPGRKLLVKASDLETWIDRHTKRPAEPIATAPRRAPRRLPGLTADGLHLQPRHTRRDTA